MSLRTIRIEVAEVSRASVFALVMTAAAMFGGGDMASIEEVQLRELAALEAEVVRVEFYDGDGHRVFVDVAEADGSVVSVVVV